MWLNCLKVLAELFEKTTLIKHYLVMKYSNRAVITLNFHDNAKNCWQLKSIMQARPASNMPAK